MIQHLILTSSEQIGYVGRNDDTADYTNLAHTSICGLEVKEGLDASKVRDGFKVIVNYLPSNFGQDSTDCRQCAQTMVEMSRFASVFPQNLSARVVIASHAANNSDLAVR
tara:strand:- start:95 stop:424 length:330 start_codon:yes stop_codon:yes gene_type:complete